MIGMAVSLLVQFIARTIFINLLGDEYNGINGLFSNILYVLNLAELGVAYSIAYALYAPLQDESRERVSAIMNFLRNVYYVVAIVVAVAGLICTPFLQYLIKEDLSTMPFALRQIRTYFLIYLANTVFSYIWSYKRTLITADQKSYVISNADNIGNIAMYLIQIVMLLIWRNYYLYLGLMLAKTIFTNVIITAIANKKYPYLKENKKLKIDREDKLKIAKNVGALFFHKFGSVVIYGTTTIIISAFVGVIEAGWYSNYLLIVHAVASFISIIFNSITASVGNLCVTEGVERQKEVFNRVSYASNALVVFSFVCYVVLFNDFIEIWVGGDKIFNIYVVIAIAANAVLTTLRQATNTFKNAKGLFVKDWYKSIVEAFAGIGLAIGFSYVWGTFGVVFGYLLSSLLIALPIEVIVLYKYGFEDKGKGALLQFLSMAWTAIQAGAIAALLYFATSFFPGGVLWFILKAVICAVCSIVIYILLSFKTKEFRYYKGLLLSAKRKLFKK